MNPRDAATRGGLVAGACMACCAPPIIAALGVTVGIAAALGVFIGLAAAFAALLLGGVWIAARARRSRRPEGPLEPVPVAAPTSRNER